MSIFFYVLNLLPCFQVLFENTKNTTLYVVWASAQAMMKSSNGNIFRVTGPLCGEFTPHKGQWRGVLMFPLIYTWTNGLVNNRDAGDLRRHLIHYDVTMIGFMRRNSHAKGVIRWYIFFIHMQYFSSIIQLWSPIINSWSSINQS